MMNCTWGYTWHGRYLYHSWLFWLLVITVVAVTLFFMLSYRRRRKQQPTCSNCRSPVEAVYLRCPECGQELKSHCPGCHHIIDKSWQCCPHCKETFPPETEKETTDADMLSV